jgi:hypothetical protein
VAGINVEDVRRMVNENRRWGDTKPNAPHRRIYVDRYGNAYRGDQVDSDKGRQYSQVPQDVFSAVWEPFSAIFGPAVESPPYGADRLVQDKLTVLECFPPGTEVIELNGVTGFVYRLWDEHVTSYTLVAYFDGVEYQVKVIEPEIEGKYGFHDAHVFGDARICLAPPSGGVASLSDAYAKSVLWTKGFGEMLVTGKFSL